VDFQAGTQVTSVVRLVRPLGRGGMGAVWVAEHQTLRTEVVVKFMADALAFDPVSLARFSHEASAAAAVKSPHVVQMLDHGFTEDGTPFIVMELLDGEDLRKRLQRDEVIPLAELGVIIIQACKALGRAHSTGIIHRDIKPDNIFLCRTDDGEPFVKLLDFGVAKSAGPTEFHMTQTGVMVGTPFYMSPEQAVGAPPVDATTDLWSLGVVAYEAMTGTRPFDGPTIGALTIAICNEGPPVPSAIKPSIPTHVDAWLARVCARDRTKRFPTAKMMSEALSLALRGQSMPRATPLAFAETFPPDTGSPAYADPAPPMRRGPAVGSTVPLETASGLTTTPAPLTRTTDRPLRPPTPFAPMQTPLTRPTVPRRGAYVAGGVTIIALGVALGFVFAERGVDPGPPPSAAAVSTSAPQAPPATMPSAAPAPPVAAIAPADTARADAAVMWVASKPPSGAAPHGATVSPPSLPPPSPVPPKGVPPVGKPLSPPSAGASPPTGSPPGCDPPFYFDAAHNKIFKKECL
jgi:serine/threonine protein kinase